MSVPTSAATWLCTTAPIASPRSSQRTTPTSVLTARSATSASASCSSPPPIDTHTAATGRRQQCRGDRAVSELRGDDRDPQDDREQRRDPDEVDERELEVEPAALRQGARADLGRRPDPDERDEHDQVRPPAPRRPDLSSSD